LAKKEFLHRFTPKSGRDVDSLARLAYVLTHEQVYPFFISGNGTGADVLSKPNNHSYMKPFETGGIVFQMSNSTVAPGFIHCLPPSRSIPSECRIFEPHHYHAMNSSLSSACSKISLLMFALRSGEYCLISNRVATTRISTRTQLSWSL
jgi:hypothetical protein